MHWVFLAASVLSQHFVDRQEDLQAEDGGVYTQEFVYQVDTTLRMEETKRKV